MKSMVTWCDMCGAKDAECFSYTIGRKMDAAGSMNDEDLMADLCKKCELVVYRKILSSLQKSIVENILLSIVNTKNQKVFKKI